MSSVNRNSTKSKIVWNKLKEKIDVLQPTRVEILILWEWRSRIMRIEKEETISLLVTKFDNNSNWSLKYKNNYNNTLIQINKPTSQVSW